MSATWVVGDIHGCAEELQRLLSEIGLQAGDRLIAVGDLFHRGPDPVGVLRLMQQLGDSFDMVLGNHEWALLKRWQDGSEVASIKDLRGDNQTAMHESMLPVAGELFDFLQHRPYFLRGECEGTWWTDSPQQWLVVHGSVLPGTPVEQMQPADIVRLSRCHDRPGGPLWHEVWDGPEFVVFGHAQSAAGLHTTSSGDPACYGLDTGCVYGGALTALRIEDLSVCSIS